MDKESLLHYIFEKSTLFDDWHWFHYHFRNGRPFAVHIVDACLECEEEMEGFAKSFLNKLFSISGRERYKPHYDQLMQTLAELLVIKQLVNFDWKEKSIFKYEPTPKSSAKNPEICIEFENYEIGVEVKSPSLREHSKKRSQKPFQLPARSILRDELRSIISENGNENITLPRDNPVKDFLLSSEDKFSPFKGGDKDFYGILAIVWDDHIYEPISSLTSEMSGLFTDQSFARDEEDNPLQFETVDGVVIIRHLHQFRRAAAEDPLLYSRRHVLDYGKEGEFPFKALVSNPHGSEIPEEVINAFQAYPPSAWLGAEYQPIDFVSWF
jgi:hypothetical protein